MKNHEVLQTSPSRLKDYSLCPKLYYYKYHLELLQPEATALLLGRQYHSIVEKFHTNQEVIIEGENKEKLELWLSKYKLKPVEGTIVDVEKRFTIEVGDIIVRGIYDRIDTDKIVEYKTSSKDYTIDDTKTWQSWLYIWNIKKTTGINMPIVYSVMNKTKAKTIKYIPQQIVLNMTDEEIDAIDLKLEDTCNKIRNNEFEETPGDHCSYCPFGSGYNGTKNCINGKYIGKKVL